MTADKPPKPPTTIAMVANMICSCLATCAIFEKKPGEKQTHKIAQANCVLAKGSGTGVYAQTFTWDDGLEFSVMAENFSDTPHLEFSNQDGPAFYSEQELYDFNSCYITPHDGALFFHCFRADED